MADDLMQRIRWLEQELREEEPEQEWEEEDTEQDELGPGYNYAVDFHRAIYADEEPLPLEKPTPAARRKEKKKKKSNRDLAFLAILEVLGILAILGWWLR